MCMCMYVRTATASGGPRQQRQQQLEYRYHTDECDVRDAGCAQRNTKSTDLFDVTAPDSEKLFSGVNPANRGSADLSACCGSAVYGETN